MFKIGEFSRLGQVTIETLRHYDAIGLLKPAHTDQFTGYRYYSATQLRPLNRIRALKELGFSLDEVARILHDELTDDELRGMLKMQQLTAERELQAVQSRLERIMARLSYLNMEDDMTMYEVTLKAVDALAIAAIREVVPMIEQVPERCRIMFDTVAKWMVEQNLCFGPPMTIYLNEGYAQQDIDLECAFILPDGDPDLSPPAPIEIGRLAAVPQMAVTVVTGDFYQKVNSLTPAYNALGKWIEVNGYRIVGPPRELFHGSPQTGDLTAEIQFPVEKG